MPHGLPGVHWERDRRCCCLLGVRTEQACGGAVGSPGRQLLSNVCLHARSLCVPPAGHPFLPHHVCPPRQAPTSRLHSNVPPAPRKVPQQPPASLIWSCLVTPAPAAQLPPPSQDLHALLGGDTATERAGVLAAAPGLSLDLFTSSLNWASVEWRSADVQLEETRTSNRVCFPSRAPQ